MSANFDQTLNTVSNTVALVVEVLKKAAGDDLVEIKEGTLDNVVAAKLQARVTHLL